MNGYFCCHFYVLCQCVYAQFSSLPQSMTVPVLFFSLFPDEMCGEKVGKHVNVRNKRIIKYNKWEEFYIQKMYM